MATLAGFNRMASASPPEAHAKAVEFDRDIRPILSDKCYTCHGPDEKQRVANLRLDTKEGLFADRGGYKIIVSGKASESKLYQKISAADKAIRMPPPYAERFLTAAQIELVRTWIDQGASYSIHWAFVPPARPAVPSVKDGKWPRNPIDNFILARLELEGLRPSPEADKATLLRRVTLDLTGLPPTRAELESFLADPSPDAYEKQVDQLLKSPHYGERMAMEWLDLARYADTHGFHIDSLREMWHWRDWVINAFNRDMPFDQFTIEQLAGDLLPNATLDQKIATGFSRNHMINYEGGAIPEEYQNEYVVDRIETTSAAWMALTMGCARCHDHKYDPIKQKEFYQFYAFFNTIPEKGLDGMKGNAEPFLPLPSHEQQLQLDQLKQDIAGREAALPEKEVAALQGEWEKSRLATLPEAPRDGLLAHYELDGNLADTSGHYQHGKTLRGDVTYDEGEVSGAASFDGEVQVDLGSTAAFERSDPFSFALWLKGAGFGQKKEMVVVQKVQDSPGREGYELLFDDSVVVPGEYLKRAAHLIVRLIHQWPDDLIQVQTRDRLTYGDWSHFTVTYDGSGRASGLKLYVGGKPAEFEVLKDKLTGSIQNSRPLEIGNKKTGAPYKGQIDDLRIYNRRLTPADVERLAVYEPVRTILGTVPGKRSKTQKENLTEYFLTYEAPENFRKLHAELKTLTKKKVELEAAIPNTMVMQEMEKPRETVVLGRGDYRNRGEAVSPGVPAVLPPLPKEAPLNRLTLAKWLVSPSHPLTARVAVNHYWQMYFGMGIVKSAENFGSQGEPPSHPELLDWLATEFIRTGWDIKAMQRLIVTSAAYRQSSRVAPALLDKDPENRLLARGPRLRLPAEIVRDNALAISGLLNEQLGGPSVYPYQPKGLWEELAIGEGFSGQSYAQGKAQDLYRRSMYTVWKRTVPPASLATFDAPDREKCTARRARTNTPLQALVLLNDPTYVEAARALAQRAIKQAGKSPARRIDFTFRLATGRTPEARERQILLQYARQELGDYRRDKSAALKLLGVGESKYDTKLDASELAAWTTVASAILNLDETVTKE